jgi:hypothetical protein
MLLNCAICFVSRYFVEPLSKSVHEFLITQIKPTTFVDVYVLSIVCILAIVPVSNFYGFTAD